MSPAAANQILNGNNQELPLEIRNQIQSMVDKAQNDAEIENATNKSVNEAKKLQADKDKIIADAKEKYGDKSGINPEIEKQAAEGIKMQEEELKKMEEEAKKKMMEEMMK